jgi:hypothetical protein
MSKRGLVARSTVTLRNWYVSAPDSKAPGGYYAPGHELHPRGSRYSFHTTGKNWDEARRICNQEGGYLVVINSEAEYNVLQNLFQLAPNTDADDNNFAFIGFHDRFVEGEYLTILGKRVCSFSVSIWCVPLYVE